MAIYKAYDIRGIFPSELSVEEAYKIGRAFVTYTKAKEVMVGRDGRLSSPPLRDNLVKGLLEQGASVIDVGVTTTPMLRLLHKRFGKGCAIQVTASHNPKEYGGFKLFGPKGVQITGLEGIPEIEKLAVAGVFKPARKQGVLSSKDYLVPYISLLSAIAKDDLSGADLHKLKVVVDASNGPAGKIVGPLLSNLDVVHIDANFTEDGNFPGHDPNPLKGEAQTQAGRLVKEHKADFACIFDADADRAVFVDEHGEPLTTDLIMAALSADYLKQYSGSSIVHDCFSSHIVIEAIKKAGGTPVVSRTGAAFVCKRMEEEDLVFGGETSGHYFFKAVDYLDDGIYTLVRVLRLVATHKKPLSTIVKGFATYHDTNQINLTVKDAPAVIEKLTEAFKDAHPSFIDGISVELHDGQGTWFIARPSNTEPLVRLRFESKDPARLEELKKRVLGLLA